MKQSGLLHVAIIMDGNGRWAVRRGLPRIAGHRAGVDALRRTVAAAPDLGIGILTVYAFSSDNWRRPADEVSGLMALLRSYLRTEVRKCVKDGVRIAAIGRRDRLEPALVRDIETAERATADGSRVTLRVALDYSSRDALLAALPPGIAPTRDAVSKALGPDVDLLIRTSGEQRLSDFLLWECAYAELFFTPTLWPDFGREELASAVGEFKRRDRRFGALAS
jgi:undecaprenyl diphosphate synthase